MQSMGVMDRMEKGRMWYNKMGWVGFRRTVKVSKKMRVVEKCHRMEWMKPLFLTVRSPQQVV